MDTVSHPPDSYSVTPDEARGGAQRPHTSYSQLETYRSCSLKYYMRYVEKRPSPPKLVLAKGKAGHAAIEKNHHKKAKDDIGITKPDLLQTFSDVYDSETFEISRDELEPEEDIGKTKDDVIDSLTVYHHKTAPKIHPIAVELSFNLDLPATEDYQYPIRIVNGRIDLVDSAGIFDAKFAGRRKSQADVDETWQLSLYDRVFTEMTGMQTPGLGFMVFTPPGMSAKNPAPADVQILMRSKEEMAPEQRARRWDRLEHTLRTTQKAIDAGIFMPADDPKTCSWCEYRTVCKSSLAKDDFAAIQIRQKG
jgi:CRISPR/Cas system-associated exonuclease Cas4 (RecB family)